MRDWANGVNAAVVALAVCAMTASTAAAAGIGYRIEPVAASGEAEGFQPVAINDAGEVVGSASYPADATGVDPNIQATKWDDGQTTRVVFGQAFSQGLAINAAGDVAGYGDASDGAPNKAFAQHGGKTNWLPPIIDGPTVAHAISDNGQVAGLSVVDDHKHLVRWQDDQLHDLGTLPDGDARPTAINDAGEIVGYWTMLDADDRLARTPFIHRDGQLTPLGGGLTGAARDIAENGVVVGTTDAASPRAFSWDDGAIELLALPEGVNTSAASAVNDAGLIVGSVGDAPADSRAVFWIDHEVTELNDLIDRDSGWWLTAALDVNNRGQILGFGFAGDEPTYFLLTPNDLTPPPSAVPLPSTVAMIGFATPLVYGAMRRMRRGELV